ncbi:KAP family P-loop NTPase fold protein [Acinetobacter tandoii]|uniref:KAP family P-loop NTPase fold protein n=1 Tax=Acinetobacter tandoii TaxID=202954 RepID=UPI000C20D775|nr:P-loop NTPase fold protein [Acinetobacter tandoii]
MTTIDKYAFSADKPIKNLEQDLLGRVDFAKNLSDAISQWKGDESLVIALHGDWGSGKSSIKNMALSHSRQQHNSLTIIEFSPWEWSAQDKIIQAFFDEVSKSIGRKDSSKEDQKLANIFAKYGNHLSTAHTILKGANLSVPLLTTTILGTGLASSYFTDNTQLVLLITTLTSLIPIIMSVTQKGSELLGKMSENFSQKAKLNEKTLAEIRNELIEALGKRETPLLIVMDDIDRLTTVELRMIFQLIKANTDFPNVIFLLLFQKDIVEKKLTDTTQSGENYLEKIIQIPFTIPQIQLKQVHEVLFNLLDNVINSHTDTDKRFDQQRFIEIYHKGLKNYFNNLRNVYRFNSTLCFNFNLFKNNDIFEADPADLIAIECLRVFEPNVYSKLSNSKEAFTTLRSTSSDNQAEKVKYSRIIEDIIKSASEKNRESVEGILKSLFPTTQWIISNYYYDHSSYQEWFTQLRVCHKDHFDKYFKLSFDSESFSTSDFIDFLQQTSNRTQLKEKILALDARNVLEDFLSKFEAYSKQVPKENFESYLYAMFDTCEEVSIESSSSIFFTAQRRLFGLSFWCLESIENRQERAKLLINYINQYSNFSIIEDILIKEHKSRDNNADTLLDDLDFEQLKKDFILKLSQFCISNPDPIIKNSSFRSFMYRWIEWGNSSDTLNWFESETQDIQGILKILKTMIQSTTSYGGSYTKPHIKKYIKASTVENFLDIPRILNIIDSTDTSVLSDEEKELIDMLKKGIENRTNGKDDDLDD